MSLRLSRTRLITIALLGLFVAMVAAPTFPGLTRIRYAWLDLCQQLAPRPAGPARTVIVAIDDPSLARYGQWPWPRTRVAQLMGSILKAHPAAVGLDIFMPEPDRVSPPALPALVPTIGPELAARLAAVPSNDSVLAATLRGRPVVLGVVGVDRAAVATGGRPSNIVPARIVG